MSLIDVCYEQIKDNFWYGLFGDFKLVIDKNTGYFNATKLCASGGKQFKHWLQNLKSKEIINKVEEKQNNLKALYVISGGDKNKLVKSTTGTYVHPSLLQEIRRWSLIPKNSDTKGWVYVATTKNYKVENIYKIGFTKNLERRLGQFNSYRTNFDLFYFEDSFRTDNAEALEKRVHIALADYWYEKEFFKCDLPEIIETIKLELDEELCNDLEKLNIV